MSAIPAIIDTLIERAGNGTSLIAFFAGLALAGYMIADRQYIYGLIWLVTGILCGAAFLRGLPA